MHRLARQCQGIKCLMLFVVIVGIGFALYCLANEKSTSNERQKHSLITRTMEERRVQNEDAGELALKMRYQVSTMTNVVSRLDGSLATFSGVGTLAEHQRNLDLAEAAQTRTLQGQFVAETNDEVIGRRTKKAQQELEQVGMVVDYSQATTGMMSENMAAGQKSRMDQDETHMTQLKNNLINGTESTAKRVKSLGKAIRKQGKSAISGISGLSTEGPLHLKTDELT